MPGREQADRVATLLVREGGTLEPRALVDRRDDGVGCGLSGLLEDLPPDLAGRRDALAGGGGTPADEGEKDHQNRNETMHGDSFGSGTRSGPWRHEHGTSSMSSAVRGKIWAVPKNPATMPVMS